MNYTKLTNDNITNLIPKLDLICGKDDLRPQFNHIEVGREYMYATDAHVLARYETIDIFNESTVTNYDQFNSLLQDRNIYIHSEDYKKLYISGVCCFEFINGEKPMLKILNNKKRPQIIELNIDSDMNYPKCEIVIPEIVNDIELNKTAFNHVLLSNLCKALRIENVELSFTGQNKAINVLNNGKSFESLKFRALIMPIRIND